MLRLAVVALAGAATFVACAAPSKPSVEPATSTAPLDASPSVRSNPVSSAARPSSTPVQSTPARPRRVQSTPARSTPARHRNGTQVVDVFGDSIGWTLVNYLPATPGFRFVDRTVLGCGVVRGGPYRYFGQQYADPRNCDRWPVKWAQWVRSDRPDEVVLVVGRWETMDRVYRGKWTHVGDSAFDEYLAGLLGRAITVLHSTGATVMVTTEPYNRRGEQPNGQLYPEDAPARVDAWNAIVSHVVAQRPGTVALDLNKKLCPRGQFTWTVHGIQVRSDGVHLTPDGVRWLTPWLMQRLRRG